MSDTDELSDTLSTDYSSDEEFRDWDALLGTKNKETLRDWLADQCPAYVCLHDCHLHTGVWDNTTGKTHEERREKYQARLTASWNELYALCQKAFQGTDLRTNLLAVERREDETEAYEVLEDFWGDLRETWMVVANGDARDALRPLKNGLEILTMAEIHRKVAMSPKNMTELASAVLRLENPNIYAIRRTIDDIDGSNRRDDDDAMMWNFPAAQSVLKHLVACHRPLNFE